MVAIFYAIMGALILNTGGVTIDETTGQASFDSGPGFFGIMIAYAVILLFSVVVGQFVGAAIVRGGLDVADGKPVTMSSIWQGWDRVQVILAGVLVGLGIAIGYVLCFIPAIIFGFLAQYTLFFVVDQKMKAWDALMASINFTRTHLGETIVFYLLSALAIFVGALLCGLGLLVAVPVVIIGTAYTYRILNGQTVTPVEA